MAANINLCKYVWSSLCCFDVFGIACFLYDNSLQTLLSFCLAVVEVSNINFAIGYNLTSFVTRDPYLISVSS